MLEEIKFSSLESFKTSNDYTKYTTSTDIEEQFVGKHLNEFIKQYNPTVFISTTKENYDFKDCGPLIIIGTCIGNIELNYPCFISIRTIENILTKKKLIVNCLECVEIKDIKCEDDFIMLTRHNHIINSEHFYVGRNLYLSDNVKLEAKSLIVGKKLETKSLDVGE